MVLHEDVVLPLALHLQPAFHFHPAETVSLVLLPCSFVDLLLACEDAESLSFCIFHFSLIAASLQIDTLRVELRFALS
jgi:hypothetical protein